MTFGAVHWLWLLLLAAPLVALYTRRPRRPVVRVPALHLWTAIAGPARTPGRRLLGRLDERLLALLLFLLALAGVVLGLARPGEAPGEARAAAFVVDVGAAMAVRDGLPRQARLERAREALARLEADLGPQGRRWVIAAGAAPSVVAGPDDALPPGAPGLEGGRADLEAAVALAREALALAGVAGEVVVLGASGDAPGGARAVDLRAPPAPARDLALDGRLTRLDARHVRLQATVDNRGARAAAALLEVRLDGAPVVREAPQPVTPGDRVSFPPRDLPCPAGGVLEVALVGVDGPDAALAWVVPPARRLRAALRDPGGSRFLRAALEADPLVDLVAADGDAAALVTTLAGGEAPAVVRVGPRALAGAPGLAVTGEVGPCAPRLAPGADAGLDLVGLDLEDRLVARAARVEADATWRPLALAGEGGPPLVLARDVDGRREVALAFDPADGDLVLGRAFPLLLARALRGAARHDPAPPRWTRAGEVAVVDGGARARAPDGAPAPLARLPDGRAALRLDRGPGVYAVEATAGDALVAARALPRPVEAPPLATSTAPAAPVEAGARDLARGCVLLALLCLVLEAGLFHRRGLP
ncbi:MAG: BatA domain-containing protein [Planctomycetes bacterium]|nr:BatA domain-containing protein [Planctomycetota bacterium]